jgi:hypothetical protein
MVKLMYRDKKDNHRSAEVTDVRSAADLAVYLGKHEGCSGFSVQDESGNAACGYEEWHKELDRARQNY